MPYSNKHIIQQHRPYRTLVLIIIVVAASSIIQWFIQKSSNQAQQLNLVELQKENTLLSNENDALTKRIRSSEKHQSDVNIQHATIEQLRVQLANNQEQVLTLNKEILFYQSITQGNSSSKLQIRELHLRADDIRTDIIRYRLVVTQGKKITKPITGIINIILNSESNGTIQHHALSEHKLNLRHVQVLEGQIKISDNEKPVTLSVNLIQKNKITLSRTFDWQLTS